MRPLKDFPFADRRAIRVVLTDIDDTLTHHGRLPSSAYQALERLQAAGIVVVPVTGRPAGWCDMIARFWPVDGVVGENGAFYFRYDSRHHRMIRHYAKGDSERLQDRQRLAAIERQVLQEVPGAAVASDQAYREADLAIDFCEDVTPLAAADIARIVAIFSEHGATAKISSIHVNGWFGEYDKLSMCRILLREAYDLDMDVARRAIVFAGDSPNDAPMFGFFPNAVGVANVLRFADILPAQPAWVTAGEGGNGFVELAQVLLDAR